MGTPRIVAVCGSAGTGKTTTMLRFCEAAAAQGRRVGGVLQLGLQGEGPFKDGYDLLDVATGERFPFARRLPERNAAGLFFEFDDAGWGWTAERLRRAAGEAEVVVLDELGKLEGRGQGHLPALRVALQVDAGATWVLSVRDMAIEALGREIGPFEEIWMLDPETRDGLVERLLSLV